MVIKVPRLGMHTALCAALLAWGVASAQQVTVSRDSNLQAEPKADASVVGQLKQGATAEVVGKQGAWVQLKSAAGTGWTFSFNVNYGSGGPPSATATPQRRPTTTATIGIRGADNLTEEELKGAKFDGKQLDALDAFSTGAEDYGAAKARKGK